MKDRLGRGDGGGEPGAVADVGDVADHQRTVRVAQPFEVGRDAGPGERIVDVHAMALAAEPVDEVAADEAGAAGDEDGTGVVRAAAHATSPRASSSRRASAT